MKFFLLRIKCQHACHKSDSSSGKYNTLYGVLVSCLVSLSCAIYVPTRLKEKEENSKEEIRSGIICHSSLFGVIVSNLKAHGVPNVSTSSCILELASA